MERFLRRYWGLAALAFLVIAWTTAQLGPGVLTLLSVLVLVWAGFQAPAWCGAANRSGGGFCRNNSYGLFLGCYLREHKWQKFKMIFYSRRWREFTQGLWATPGARLATVSGVAGIVSLLAIPLTLIQPGGRGARTSASSTRAESVDRRQCSSALSVGDGVSVAGGTVECMAVVEVSPEQCPNAQLWRAG